MYFTEINIKNIESIISDNNHLEHENLKSIFEDSNIEVRNVNSELSDLYLLVSNQDVNLTPLQIECNGIIMEKHTNKVVCMCTNKYNNISSEENLIDINNCYTKSRMEYCEDGTLIRLYNYNSKWYTATTKCIDARKSYWSSEKTFDSMFWEIFDKSEFNLSDLDIKCTYSFILLHKENRIVVNHKYNNLIYISSINNESYKEDFTNHFYNQNLKRCIRRTKQIDIISGINYPLDTYFDNDNLDKRGVIIKFLDEINNKWVLYKYDFSCYSNLKEIRGNVPLIRMRYLELLNESDKLELLKINYSENKMLFCMIEHSINNLYKKVHKLYFESHVKHSITVTEENPLFKTLKQLHGQYKKQDIIVTFQEVIKKVNTLNPNVLRKLLGWV